MTPTTDGNDVTEMDGENLVSTYFEAFPVDTMTSKLGGEGPVPERRIPGRQALLSIEETHGAGLPGSAVPLVARTLTAKRDPPVRSVPVSWHVGIAESRDSSSGNRDTEP